ncbi:MAG: ABC transporter permease, partial [Methylobacter sp.]
PISITLSVWMALFLREAVFRLSRGRTAWIWLLLEPVIHIVALILVFTFIRMRVVGGIELAVWLVAGLLPFFMFKRTGIQTKNALDANQNIFVYRQIQPVDTLLVRAGLEGFLTILVTVILSIGLSLFGVDMAPDDPLFVLATLFGLWLMGLGFGLVCSVLIKLNSELDKFITIAMMPLYLLSGVIFPITSIPQPVRDLLLLNPLAHGIEAARLGMSSYYHAVPELSLVYLYQCALFTIFIGLALQKRFAIKLVMK